MPVWSDRYYIFADLFVQVFRKFYLCFSDEEIVNTCVHDLTWSHFRTLLHVQDESAKLWYISEAVHENWSVRTLDQNIGTQYYYRLMQAPDPDAVKNEMLQKISSAQKSSLELMKSPVIAEFLGFKDSDTYLETVIRSR